MEVINLTPINTKSGLELIATPVIITDLDGLVLFKNECAMRKFKNPMRRKSILKYISGDSALLLHKIKVSGGEIATLCIDRFCRNAVVLPCAFEETECAAFIFVPYLQPHLFPALHGVFEDSLPVLKRIFDELLLPYENSHKLSDTRTEKLRDYYETLISLLFREDDGIGDGKKYRVLNTLNIIRAKAGGLFAKYGYRLSISDEIVSDSTLYLFDMRNYVIMLFQTLLFAFSIAENKTVAMHFAANSDRLCSVLSFKSAPLPESISLLSSFDISELLPLCPSEYLNLMICKTLCRQSGFSFKCVADGENSLIIHFEAAVSPAKLSLGSNIADDDIEIESFIELLAEIF